MVKLERGTLIDAQDRDVTVAAHFNPMLFEPEFMHADRDMYWRSFGEVVQFLGGASWRHKPGSWRSMQIPQPPVTHLENFLSDVDQYPEPRTQQGFTVGDLIDEIVQSEAAGLKMKWHKTGVQLLSRVVPTEEELAEYGWEISAMCELKSLARPK